MESLSKKIKRILTKSFPPPDEVDLDGNGSIIGTIVSERFKGLDAVDRVRLIWSHLEKDLSKKERTRVVLLLGMTPREKQLHSST